LRGSTSVVESRVGVPIGPQPPPPSASWAASDGEVGSEAALDAFRRAFS